MVRNKLASVKLSQAIEGFLRYKTSTGKSPATLSDYRNSLSKLRLFFTGDPPFASIDREQLIRFFAWLTSDYVSEPGGVAPRGQIRLAAKSRLNIYLCFSSFWQWGADEGMAEKNLIRTIDAPAVSKPDIQPYSKEEVEAMLNACDVSRSWKNRQGTNNRRPSADRDRAILLTLMDTGARASELIAIEFAHINFKDNSLVLFGKGPGTDPKKRKTYIGKRTAQAIWKYLAPRLDTIKDGDPVFVNETQAPYGTDYTPMTRTGLYKLIKRLAARARVKDADVHRFRHTFAINFLRNGGDVFTLKALLGHADLDTVEIYVNLAQTDYAKAHAIASPVDRWKL